MPPGREHMYSSETPAKVKKRPGVTEDPLAPKQHVKAAKQAAGVGVPKIPKPPNKKANPNREGEDGSFKSRH